MELLLSTFVIVLFSAIAYKLVKACWRIFKALLAVIKRQKISGPNRLAFSAYTGVIADSKNWHAAGGDFHAEFWIKDQNNLERRYKFSGINPEVRRGHKVTIYEYAGIPASILNKSTGQEVWVVPNSLLRALYPSRRVSKFVFRLTLILISIFTMTNVNSIATHALLPTLVMVYLIYLLVRGTKYLLHKKDIRQDRVNKFALFCTEAARH